MRHHLTWLEFSNKPEIKKLPLHEQKKRYLLESDLRLQENIYLAQMYGGGGAGGFGGSVIDGPIAGAIVTANTGTAITDAAGNFTLPSKPTGPITVTGGTDAITGVAFEGELVGYPEYKTISPITTFAHYLKEASVEDAKIPTLTIDEAVTKTFVSSSDYFGINLPIEDKDVILQKDFIKEAIENNNKVCISAQAVTAQIESIAETVGVALDGSVIATKSRDKGETIPQFSAQNRKRTAYAALGRQVGKSGGITPSSITNEVKFFNPLNGRIEEGGVDFEANNALSKQLTATIAELRDLAKQEQYTNNYLTTRIQAVNRAQKTTIKNETRNAVENRGTFSNINTVSTSSEVEDALRQIEKDKANETAPVLDGTPNTISRPAFYQTKKNTKSGQEQEVALSMRVDKNYYFFGTAKDLPILMRSILPDEPGGDITYAVAEFLYTFDATTATTNAISLDMPCLIKIESKDPETGITTSTTYTFRPFVSSKDEEGTPSVGLRLSSISVVEEKPKAVDHITATGTYTPSFTTSGGGFSGKMTGTVVEGPAGNVLDIFNEFDAKTRAYSLEPTKTPATFTLFGFDFKSGARTELAAGITFDGENVASAVYKRLGPGGEETVTWTISYEASSDVTHIAPEAEGVYSFVMAPPLGIPKQVPMTTNTAIGGNNLTLTSFNLDRSTLNNIKLAPDARKPGQFLLTAGNEGDNNTITGIGTGFVDNVWSIAGVIVGKTSYNITITFSAG